MLKELKHAEEDAREAHARETKEMKHRAAELRSKSFATDDEDEVERLEAEADRLEEELENINANFETDLQKKLANMKKHGDKKIQKIKSEVRGHCCF